MPQPSPIRSADLLTGILDSVPTAVIVVDRRGSIVLANAQAERLFGYSSDELLGETVNLLLPLRYRSGHAGLRAGFMRNPQSRPMGAGRDLFGLHRDGSEFPVEIGLNPVDTDDGLFVLAAIVDISERKRAADAALRQANEVLERSNIELQRFVYVASHDLQTPMRNVASFVELLQATDGNQLDTQGQDWIRRIVQSVKPLQTLVQDLLEYSRIDSQAHPFTAVPFQETFAAAEALLETSIRESGAEIRHGELPTVMGDKSQLVQLLINLIGTPDDTDHRTATAADRRCDRPREGALYR